MQYLRIKPLQIFFLGSNLHGTVSEERGQDDAKRGRTPFGGESEEETRRHSKLPRKLVDFNIGRMAEISLAQADESTLMQG